MINSLLVDDGHNSIGLLREPLLSEVIVQYVIYTSFVVSWFHFSVLGQVDGVIEKLYPFPS